MKTKMIFIMTVMLSSIVNFLNAQSTAASNTLSGTAPNPTQFIGSGNGFDIVFKTSGAEKARLLNSNGNFGIGISNPLAKLQVAGPALFTTSASATSAAYIRGNIAYSTATTPDYTWWGNDQTGIFKPAANTIGFTMGGIEAMRINSSGSVGIGTMLTTNPNSYKLAVNGIIGAKAIKVEITSTTWADYVFEKNYKIMSLTDLQKFIAQNKHLPGIPTSDEIEKSGLDLGEMVKLQMKKIEELTLYMIQLKNENDELKKSLEELKLKK